VPEHGVGPTVEETEHPVEVVRGHDVVGGRPLEVRAAHVCEQTVVVGVRGEVDGVPQRLDTPVGCGCLGDDVGGAVGRRVVAHDETEVAHRLTEDRFDRGGEVRLAVPYGESDGDAWSAAVVRPGHG